MAEVGQRGRVGSYGWRTGARGLLAVATLGLCAANLGELSAHAATAAAACPASAVGVFTNNGADPVEFDRIGSAKRLRILAIGSSSTQGVGASAPGRAYPARLAADITSEWGVAAVVRNAGVGGELAPTTLVRLKAELTRERPDLVVWQVGTNDAVTGADLAKFRATLEGGVSAARARDVPLVLVDPQFFPGIKNLPRFERYVAAIGEVGARDHVPVYSRFTRMKAVADRSAVGLRALMSPDGFHMGDRGYACLAQALADDLAVATAHGGRSPTPSKAVASKM